MKTGKDGLGKDEWCWQACSKVSQKSSDDSFFIMDCERAARLLETASVKML